MAVVKAISTQELAALANRLRLTLIRDRMEEMLTMAVDKKLSPRETLEFFFRQEIRRREENRIRQAIMGAHFPAVRTLEDFDFEAQPSIDVKQLKELAQLEWVGQAKNVLFLGPPGVGKTHLAIALGREAIKLGMSVAFYSAEELGSLLDRALKEGTIKQKLYQRSKPKLLVLDEFGYTPFSSVSAPLLFRLINSRYEQKSILITSNKPVSEWAGVLGDATLTTAMLDRLLHHSEIIVIRGDSYRLLEKRKEGLLTSARAVGTALTDQQQGLNLNDVFGGQFRGRLTNKKNEENAQLVQFAESLTTRRAGHRCFCGLAATRRHSRRSQLRLCAH